MRLFILFLLGVLILSPSARAEVMKVAVAEIPPYTLKNGNEPAGILVDVVRMAAHRTGHKVEFSFYPWPRAVQYVKSARADAIVPFFKSEERKKYVFFPDHGIMDMELALFRKSGSGIDVPELSHAMPFRIIKVNKVNLGRKFSEMMEKNILTVEHAPNTEIALRQVLADRVELFASESTITKFAAQRYGFAKDIEQAGPVFDTLTCFIAFAKGSEKSRAFNEITAEIARMKQAGVISTIVDRYMKPERNMASRP